MSSSSGVVDVEAVRLAWNRSTSATPEEWTRKNPARGQCAITALICQLVRGGKLVRTVATKPDGTEESHYAHMDDLGVILDLTDSQFPEGTEFGPWEERTREYVLSFPATVDRYSIFLRRLQEVRVVQKVQGGSPVNDE